MIKLQGKFPKSIFFIRFGFRKSSSHRICRSLLADYCLFCQLIILPHADFLGLTQTSQTFTEWAASLSLTAVGVSPSVYIPEAARA